MSNEFDPSAALKAAMEEVDRSAGINIHGKSYKQVAARVLAFRKHFGTNARLRIADCTEDEKGKISMRAVVELYRVGYAPEDTWVLVAEGRAEEVRGSSNITKTSAMEVCETSAYGRALANLGLHGGEFASANEVENAVAKQGDRSGRSDTSSVDPLARDWWVVTLRKSLQEGDKEAIYRAHESLRTQEELFTAVWDKLKSTERTDLRKIIADRPTT